LNSSEQRSIEEKGKQATAIVSQQSIYGATVCGMLTLKVSMTELKQWKRIKTKNT
jgi:hypothetical protein